MRHGHRERIYTNSFRDRGKIAAELRLSGKNGSDVLQAVRQLKALAAADSADGNFLCWSVQHGNGETSETDDQAAARIKFQRWKEQHPQDRIELVKVVGIPLDGQNLDIEYEPPAAACLPRPLQEPSCRDAVRERHLGHSPHAPAQRRAHNDGVGLVAALHRRWRPRILAARPVRDFEMLLSTLDGEREDAADEISRLRRRIEELEDR